MLRVRVGAMHRTLLLTSLAFLMMQARAQPGDLTQPYMVKVVLDHPLYRDHTTFRFEVRDPRGQVLDRHFILDTTRDSVLLFTLPPSATPGLWQLTDRWSGRVMQLNLQPYESPIHTTITLPYTQGAYNVDIVRLWKCFTDQAPELQDNDEPWPVREDTIACSGGRVVWARGHGGSEVRFFDLLPFTYRVEQAAPSASREASYPGGMANFQRFIRTHFSRPLIERTGVRAKLSALVTIETDGSIHQVQLNGSAYPELDREFKRVLQQSSWWEPAAVENIRHTIDPRSFRYIEQSKVIEYNVDPDSIWVEIPEEALSISPLEPTSRDSIYITLLWMDGSCGQYAGDAELLPSVPGEVVRTIILRFGATRPNMCEDVKALSWTHVMPPLSPGRYRLHRADMPGLAPAAWAADPYAVREFAVRP